MHQTMTCNCCGWAGDPDLVDGYEMADGMYDRSPTPIAVQDAYCPDCGSENLEPCVLCDSCGRNPAAPHMDDCEECLEKQEAEQDALVDRIKELRLEMDEYLP